MNFDEIENLSEENINELYDDIIDGNLDKLSVCVCSGCYNHRQAGYEHTDICAPNPGLHTFNECNWACTSQFGCNYLSYEFGCPNNDGNLCWQYIEPNYGYCR